MTELEELRLVVRAQSKLLMSLVDLLRQPTPKDLDQDEVDGLMEEVADGLGPHLTREYFPLAPEWMRMN